MGQIMIILFTQGSDLLPSLSIAFRQQVLVSASKGSDRHYRALPLLFVSFTQQNMNDNVFLLGGGSAAEMANVPQINCCLKYQLSGSKPVP